MASKEKIKIIFFGTPQFAVVILKALIKIDYDIAAVFTQPDKKIGRKQEVVFSPVKDLALKNKIEIFQPESLRDTKLAEEMKKINPDLFIVAAYGKILPKEILEIPKYGAINVHASLLPKYRGASPVQCAIINGEKETGITLMKMNEKMDEGDILVQEKIKINENDTTDTLMKKMAELGAKMTVKFVSDWVEEKIKPTKQNHADATYCKTVKKEDGKIDWSNTAEEIYRQWRAYLPWPGIFSDLKIKNQQKRLKLLKIENAPDEETGGKPGKIVKYNRGIAVQAKKGLVILKKIQLEGKKEMDVSDFVRGFPEFIGEILK
jgi:methionyl-tRNA formyltransferase